MSSPAITRRNAQPDASLAARFRAHVYALRNLLAALPVGVAFFATSEVASGLASFVPAAALVMLGVALRAWCTHYNRFAQGERKALATGGPYACLRNPLYVGNALVLSGCAVASGLPWLLPVSWVWAFLVYDQVVRHEERRLFQKYGTAYARYWKSVPRWIPNVFAPLGPLPDAFLPALLVQSRSLLFLLPFAAKAWVLGAWPAA